MAHPNELDSIFDSWLFRVLGLQDSNLKPSPVTSKRIITEALITRLGDQFHAMDSLDGVGI